MVGKIFVSAIEMPSILHESSGVITVAFNNYFSSWKIK